MAGGLIEELRSVHHSAALGVLSAEHQPADPGVAYRPGAHRAGLQGDHQRQAGEAVVAKARRGRAQGDDLGVGGGIMGPDRLVGADGDDLARRRIHDDSADRGLPGGRGGLRRFKGDAHGAMVMVHDPLRAQPDDPGQVNDAEGGERIAKLLARAGVGSRRDVERLIAEGRVGINGRNLTTPAVKVEPGDILTVDGEVVGEPEPARLFRYHKPVGLVTTHKDPAGRPTVFEALPPELPRLISVGRLDVNSEGLLLLTNDGALARTLEMPATAIARRYRARAYGRVTQARLDTLQKGITVEGVRYGAIEAKLDKAKDGPQGSNLWITLTLNEGKNREVRRVLEALGLKVNRLIRLAYGPFALGPLGVGEVEEVGPRVIREQLAEYIEPENLPTGDRPQYRTRSRTSRRPSEATEVVPVLAPRPEKMAYKPGWAKPKPKARPPAPVKTKPAGPDMGSRPKTERRPKTTIKAKVIGRPKATAQPKPTTRIAAPSKARPSGSPPAAGPRPGPRGPKPAASPRGTPGARPPGRPRSGGRGPRG